MKSLVEDLIENYEDAFIEMVLNKDLAHDYSEKIAKACIMSNGKYPVTGHFDVNQSNGDIATTYFRIENENGEIKSVVALESMMGYKVYVLELPMYRMGSKHFIFEDNVFKSFSIYSAIGKGLSEDDARLEFLTRITSLILCTEIHSELDSEPVTVIVGRLEFDGDEQTTLTNMFCGRKLSDDIYYISHYSPDHHFSNK